MNICDKHTWCKHREAQRTPASMLARCILNLFPWGKLEPPSPSGCDSGTSLLDPPPSHSHWTRAVPGPDPQKSLCAQNSEGREEMIHYFVLHVWNIFKHLKAEQICKQMQRSKASPFRPGCSLCHLIWEVSISKSNMVFICFTFFTSIS